jgi:hypothetical protein
VLISDNVVPRQPGGALKTLPMAEPIKVYCGGGKKSTAPTDLRSLNNPYQFRSPKEHCALTGWPAGRAYFRDVWLIPLLILARS